MTTHVVLFNLETNSYLAEFSPLKLVVDWRKAQIFPNESFALAQLSNLQKVSQENKLFNWCTRTFYRL